MNEPCLGPARSVRCLRQPLLWTNKLNVLSLLNLPVRTGRVTRTPPGPAELPATVPAVLQTASAATNGRLVPCATGIAPGLGWIGASELVSRPERLHELADAAGRDRFHSDERCLVLHQVCREAVTSLAKALIDTWCRQRRLLDVRATNVALSESRTGTMVGLKKAGLMVLPGDLLAGHPGVQVTDETTMFRHLVDALGYRLPAEEAAPAAALSATATIIAATKRLARSGDRHLWGSLAAAVASGLTRAGHVVGGRADRDLDAILAARPDLAGTIELVTVPDACDPADPGGAGAEPDGSITFALRRTCCLLYKMPGGTHCSTCSLRDRDCRAAELAEWYRAERREMRTRHDRF